MVNYCVQSKVNVNSQLLSDLTCGNRKDRIGICRRDCAMVYDATTTRIFHLSPYSFFSVIGIVCASSVFILLELKYGYRIPRYTKLFFLSGLGMLAGARFFGYLTGLFIALANNEPVTLETFKNTGIVFYGGVIGFILSFLLLCKIWYKKIEHGVLDIVIVCIPLFHFWGRLGCFFGGCCYGIETQLPFSVLYTTFINDEVVTASRVPVQLVEASLNILLFLFLLNLLNIGLFRDNLVKVYFFFYAILRIILEFFRGDFVRGIWRGVTFSQVISIIILLFFLISMFVKKEGINV